MIMMIATMVAMMQNVTNFRNGVAGNQTRFSSGRKSFRERVSQITTDNLKELPITVTKVYSILRHACEEFLKDFVILGRILEMDPKNS